MGHARGIIAFFEHATADVTAQAGNASNGLHCLLYAVHDEPGHPVLDHLRD